MKMSDEALPQSIRYSLLKTAYPKITSVNPACSSELLAIISTEAVPQNVSLLFLHAFGNKTKPALTPDDITWANAVLINKPALFEELKEHLVSA